MANYYGTSGNDGMDYMNPGNDNMYGYGGKDTLGGGDGNDKLYGHEGDDVMYGDAGNDYLDGWTGNDKMYGGSEKDTLLGYDGKDTMYGGTGSDSLNGESGDDYLNGGGYSNNSYEYDTLTGGGGGDIFALGDSYGSFYQGGGYATITDFKWSEGDKIQVYGSTSNYTLDKTYNWSGSSSLDTAIYKNGDLIGVVQDTTNVYLEYDFISA